MGSKDNPPDWRAAAWSLERVYFSDFSRPEFQLSLNNNFTQNVLSITISPQEAREIEAVAERVRESVKSMYAAYRPGAGGNGNGQGQSTVDVRAEPVAKLDLTPIVRKEGEENSSVSVHMSSRPGNEVVSGQTSERHWDGQAR